MKRNEMTISKTGVEYTSTECSECDRLRAELAAAHRIREETLAEAIRQGAALRAEVDALRDGLLWLFYFAEQQEGFAAPEWLAGLVKAASSGGEG